MRECREGISLKEYASGKKTLTEKQISFVSKQILSIIKRMMVWKKKSEEPSKEAENPLELLRTKVYQKDLKIENFIIDPKTQEVSMIDLGYSSQFRNVNELKSHLTKPISLSPEAIKSKNKQGCVCWSVGIISYSLLEGSDPFEGKSIGELFHNIINNR